MSERRVFKLGEVTLCHDARRIPVRSTDRRPGEYPYYGASGVVDYVESFLFDGEYLLVAEDGENLRTRKTPVAFMATGKFWVNNHAHILEGNHLSNTRYLCYLLSQTDIAGFLSGSTQPKLTQAALNSIRVALPDRFEQDAIVSLLGALDDKIAVNERIAQTSRELGMAMFKSSLSNDSGTVAIGWLSSALVRGGAPAYTNDEAEPVVINQKCIRNGRVDLGPARRTASARLRADRVLRGGDVLVNSTGVGTLGRVAIWTHDITATCDSHVTIVRPDASAIPPIIAGYAILAAQPEIELLGEGSTGQTELSRHKLSEFKVRVPVDSQHNALTNRLLALEQRGEAGLSENTSLSQLRDTLLPRLISGELRIRDAERQVSGAV